jgi:hypothetical protein
MIRSLSKTSTLLVDYWRSDARVSIFLKPENYPWEGLGNDSFDAAVARSLTVPETAWRFRKISHFPTTFTSLNSM